MPTGAAFAHAGGCGGIFLKNSTEKSSEPAAGRIRLYEEPVYLAALVMLSLAVAMTAAADFGVSMIVAPAYILSLKFPFLTFGRAEYIIQALLFAVFCILMRRVKPVYLFSFVTCMIYGFVLDAWRSVVLAFNPAVTAPGSFALPVRLLLFAGGVLLCSFSIASFYKVYLYPQVYDFFVKMLSRRFNIALPKFKTCFDFCCLAAACVLTLAFFGRFRGIGVGTIIMTAVNGALIGLFGKVLDRFFVFEPLFPKVKRIFE